MLDCFKACLSPLNGGAKTLLHHATTAEKAGKCKRNKNRRRLSPSSFDCLTPSSFAAMEVTSQFKQVFKFIDENGDGKISPHELSEVLLCLGCDDRSKAMWEAERMVRQMDCDGDGLIDVDEFVGAVNHDRKRGGSSTSTGVVEEDDDVLMEAFLIFDADRNGLISARELQRVLVNLGCKKCSLQDCRRMIRGVDRDGDGFVDFHEFQSMMAAGTM
ncbi:hypothetical protein Tsubulata_021536 [Turnera subulata]|uniref:EF-hand domain-containing protein n=1 Tax=Turnera subulata TaxID=218843 RepID=A0A9Q0GAT0_9ROSI|nr:hypothetical protein Tsubulata_021536 [Turnera subulata]